MFRGKFGTSFGSNILISRMAKLMGSADKQNPLDFMCHLNSFYLPDLNSNHRAFMYLFKVDNIGIEYSYQFVGTSAT